MPLADLIADSSQGEIHLTGVARGAEAHVLARLLAGQIGLTGKPQQLLYIASNDRAMQTVAQALPFFAPGAAVLTFPAWDTLPYDRVSPRPALVAERLQVLAKLAAGDAPAIVLTTANALTQRLMPVSALKQAVLYLSKGKTVSRERLVEFLQGNGYRRVGKAVETGEFAVRGSIVDIIPAAASSGIRLDFFGDDLESLREFDPLTQLTSGAAEALTLHPVSEVILSEDNIARFRTRYRDQFGAVNRDDPLYESVSRGIAAPGIEHWLPLFYEHTSTLLDYASQAAVVLAPDAAVALEERQESICDYYEARVAAAKEKKSDAPPYHPLPAEQLYLMGDALSARLSSHLTVHLDSFERPDEGGRTLNLHLRASPSLVALRHDTNADPFVQLQEFAGDKRVAGKATLLACYSAGSRERLGELLSERGSHAYKVESWEHIRDIKGKTNGLAILPLEQGFESDSAAIVSEQDLLGERVIRARPKKRKSEAFLAEAASFMEGELVVHREHGIGRFAGLITLDVNNIKHDCLKLLYADDDKLFLPVENIELISRYGSEEEEAKLDKLGASSWQARKARMKERIQIAAAALIKTAAERKTQPAPILTPDEKYEAFCARFGYVETEDQARSIDEVAEDLQTGRPMDRLICGDVGFGKTEVALRAAFIAVNGTDDRLQMSDDKEKELLSSGIRHLTSKRYQVAVVTPTTLLARQHYRNFAERFKGFGITVRQLSRMVSAKEQKETREALAEGKVDIVVGTHALLSKQVQFKHLGLVIVDEEQHFGVGQKERLKELKANVHVLTLSATPIPRTLQMALSGLRDLSLITTPPIDRLAVRSFVIPFDPVILREAILREQHRGGRTFVVTPRIKDMPELKVKLHELVPEVKIGAVHGQMSPSDIDEMMNDFYDGKYDVLLSTAIVESGLDIPFANTMIIHRADRFGLAQLYQLRGRVGRGKQRAYAYLLLPPQRELTKDATRRLEVMQSLDTLGAGFTLASHDMDIRGCGNLVGDEQSGHIREVGIELYQQMLEEAVNALKRSAVKVQSANKAALCTLTADYSPTINLGMSVLLPESYIADLDLRMGLYRRAGQLAEPEEIEAFAAELIDRFGPLPEEVQHLLSTVRIRQLCKKAGIERIDVGPKGAVIGFFQNRFAQPERLLHYIAKHATRIKLRPDQKLVVTAEWADNKRKINEIFILLADVSGLV